MLKIRALSILSALLLSSFPLAAQQDRALDVTPADGVIWEHVYTLETMISLWPKREYYLQLADLYGRVGDVSRQLELYEVAYDMGWLDETRQFLRLAQLLLRAEKLDAADKVLQNALDLELAKVARGD